MAKFASVCIAAYNEERTIAGTLESVMQQRFDGELEVLVCANGCTDNTEIEVERMMQRYGNIKLISTTEKGKPNAWNLLRERARHNYLFFADGDVLIDREAFCYLYSALEDNPNIIGAGAVAVPILDGCDFLTKIVTYPPVKEQGCLLGRLYGVKNDLVRERLMLYDYEEMPKDIIHEDAWLTGVIGKGRWITELNARVYYTPYHWRELPRLKLRYARAREQLIRDYPEIYEEMVKGSVFADKSKMNVFQGRIKKFFITKGIMGRAELVIRFLIHKLLEYRADRLIDGEVLGDPLEGWEVSEYSKTPPIRA